jgi:hypothetical protein
MCPPPQVDVQHYSLNLKGRYAEAVWRQTAVLYILYLAEWQQGRENYVMRGGTRMKREDAEGTASHAAYVCASRIWNVVVGVSVIMDRC